MNAHTNAVSTHRKVLGSLLALTVITVLAAGVNFGSWNAVIALAIACVKASLVALFFMHLRHDKPMNAVIFVTGVAILGLFLLLLTIDTSNREPLAPAASRPIAAAGARL
jgi:cytochrome c oxidase subunit 4